MSGAKKVLDLGQCGDFTLLAKQELRGINSRAVYARKVKYYVDVKTGSYKFGWKELKYLGLVGGLVHLGSLFLWVFTEMAGGVLG